MNKVDVSLPLDWRQLDALLCSIEAKLLSGCPSRLDRGQAVVDFAAKNHPSEHSFEIEMLLPIYAVLVRHWDTAWPTGTWQNTSKQMRFGRLIVQSRAIDAVLERAASLANESP